MRLLGLVLLLACSLAAVRAQTKDPWADWMPFLGTWQGTGSGDPGQGRGEFSFAPEVQARFWFVTTMLSIRPAKTSPRIAMTILW